MENTGNANSNLTNDNPAVRNKIHTAKKEGVTKGALITGLIFLVVVVVGGLLVNSYFKQEQTKNMAMLEDQKNTFTQQVTKRDSTINSWLLSFDQIEKDLNVIKQKENRITVQSSGAEVSSDKRGQVMEDIKYINSLIEENKKKIASLNAQLKNSGGVISGLQARITSLETNMKQYEADIAELKDSLVKKDFEIGQLNTNLTALELSDKQKGEQISDQTIKMNEAYYTSGTYKELKAKGIVSKEGGFLGLGRQESLSGNLRDTQFAKIDVREIKTIPINSKNAKLITKHPADSYTLVHETPNLISYLRDKESGRILESLKICSC